MKILDEFLSRKDVKQAMTKAKVEGNKLMKSAKSSGKKLMATAKAKGKNYANAGKLKLEIMKLENEVYKSKISIADYVVEKGLPISKDNAKVKAEISKIGKNLGTIAKKNAEMKRLLK